MKTMKFRAWNIKTKGFVYSKNTNGPERDCNGGWWGDCVLDYRDEYPEIQQYTGLKDKNGKEIYEGDFVQYVSNAKGLQHGQVVWYDLGWWLWHESGNMWLQLPRTPEEREVIGNIYESPNLLSKDGVNN